jgi:hypothetical protein
MGHMADVYRVMESKPPSEDVPATANSLFALLALRHRQYKLALESARFAARQLKSARGRYSSAERVHLIRYCEIVGAKAAHEGALLFPKDEFGFEKVDNDVDRSRVRWALRSTFPVPSDQTKP